MGKVILVILVVLGLAVSIPSTRAKLETRAAPLINGVKAKLVPGRLKVMADQLEARVKRGEGFPNNWPGWLERDYTSDPQDPWGYQYFLQIGRSDFTVGSVGPDGVQGTPDDITLRRRPQPN